MKIDSVVKDRLFLSSADPSDPLTGSSLQEMRIADHGSADEPEHKVVIGVLYMLSMGICGVIIVALGSTLETIAANCGTVATALGSVFIARGIGYVQVFFFFDNCYYSILLI